MEEKYDVTIPEVPETNPEWPVSKPEPSVKPIKVIFKSMTVGGKCDVLNVRRLASLDSESFMKLKKGSVVNVNLEKSTNDFYYVASEIIDSEHKTPIHGYCKKDFLFE